MKIVGFHAYTIEGKGCIANSLGDVCDKAPYLDWVLTFGEHKLVCYDLDYFASVLFRLIGLTPEEAGLLNKNKRLRMPPYEINYYPGRWLAIDKGAGRGHCWAGIYNMAQYFDGILSLDHKPDIGTAISRAKQAVEKAKEVSGALNSLGLADKLTSPVAALKASLLSHFDMPTCEDIPGDAGQAVNDMALKACGGSWREVYSLGYFPQVYDYDMSGAYAAVLAELYDFRRGDWVQSLVRPSNAMYGLANVQVDISKEFSPIQYYLETDSSYTPVGQWETYLTLAELDFIDTYHLGDYVILDGWWWVPVGKRGPNGEIFTDKMFQPMKGLINYLWNKRQSSEGMARELAKRAMAGLWGMSLESKEVKGQLEYGDAFNPVWGAVVLANVRLEVAKLAMDNGIIPLAVAVDGLVTDRPLPVQENGGLGSWRLSHTGKAIIGGGSMVAIETKEGMGDLSLTFDWLNKKITNDPWAASYTKEAVGHVSLADAVGNDKLDRLGEVTINRYTFRVKPDNKRFYADTPLTGGELVSRQYDSLPLTVGDIKAKELVL